MSASPMKDVRDVGRKAKKKKITLSFSRGIQFSSVRAYVYLEFRGGENKAGIEQIKIRVRWNEKSRG